VSYLSNIYTASIIKMTPSCHHASNHLFYNLARHLYKKAQKISITYTFQFRLVTHFLSNVTTLPNIQNAQEIYNKNINIYTRYRHNTSSLQESENTQNLTAAMPVHGQYCHTEVRNQHETNISELIKPTFLLQSSIPTNLVSSYSVNVS